MVKAPNNGSANRNSASGISHFTVRRVACSRLPLRLELPESSLLGLQDHQSREELLTVAFDFCTSPSPRFLRHRSSPLPPILFCLNCTFMCVSVMKICDDITWFLDCIYRWVGIAEFPLGRQETSRNASEVRSRTLDFYLLLDGLQCIKNFICSSLLRWYAYCIQLFKFDYYITTGWALLTPDCQFLSIRWLEEPSVVASLCIWRGFLDIVAHSVECGVNWSLL